MARPPTIRDEDILTAARAILLERGLSATTAEVAERAGVSEGSVFHRFKTKEALFKATVHGGWPPAWIAALPGRVGKGDVMDQIAEVASEGITFFRLLIPFVMLNWSKGPDDAKNAYDVDPPPIRGLKAVASYFQAEMHAGRLAKHDPEVVARCFTGALWNFVMMDLMFDASSRMPMPEATYVRSLTRMLFEGLRPAPPLTPGRATRPRKPR